MRLIRQMAAAGHQRYLRLLARLNRILGRCAAAKVFGMAGAAAANESCVLSALWMVLLSERATFYVDDALARVEVVLETCDAFFRRVLNPTVAFFESLAFLVRVVYEPWCVLYNMVVSILRTSVQGSLYLVSKCSVELMVSLVKGSLELVIVFFKSFFQWLGSSSSDDGGGGLLKNEFDFVPVFEGVQTLVSNAVELTDCVCEEMSNGVRVFVAFCPDLRR